MKHTKALHIFLIAGMLSVAACNDAQNDKAEQMADAAAAKMDTAVDKLKDGAANMADKVEDALNGNQDSSFLVKATLTNNKELRLLQAGVDNGTSMDLKAHARLMIADHQKLGASVKSYAAKKGYILPEGDNGRADDELAKLGKMAKGAKWDDEWTDMLTAAHKYAVDLFEKGRDNVKDGELKTMIVDALPTLRSHLDMMKGMQDKMSK